MATGEDALLEIDGAIEAAILAVGEKVVLFMRQGRRVVQDAIAMVFLDEAFLILNQNVNAVIGGMTWTAGMDVEADMQVTVALENARQEVWECIADVFAETVLVDGNGGEAGLGDWETIAAFLRHLEDIFFALRANVAAVVEGAVSSPTSPASSESSSSNNCEGGVTLPLLKRRRGVGPS